MTEGRFELAAPAPSYAKRYPEYFHGPVRLEAAATAMMDLGNPLLTSVRGSNN